MLLALALFIWGYNFLKGVNLFSRGNEYYAVYTTVDGLVVNNPVEVNGLTVGQVKKMYLHPDGSGRVVVVFSVTNEDLKFKTSSIAKITSSFLGAGAISLIPGKTGEFAEPGDTLIGDKQGSIQDEVNKAILPLKNKTESLFSSVDSLVTVFRSVFNDKTRENLRQSFDNISKTIATLSHTTSEFDTLITGQRTRLANIIANVDDITNNIKNNDAKLNLIVNNIALVTDSLVKADIVGTFAKADKALTDFSTIAEKINNGQGTLGQLVNNDSLYIKLDESARSLNNLIVDLNENPERYVHFSVFGRKKDKAKPKTK